MNNQYYSTERNIQILLSVLKANGIRKVIASPGTTNFSLVGSMQNDPYFEIYSSVDERSAAYIAVGLSSQSGEPVLLTCTGATASRNYYPGMTEAYYRKLPILAVTSHQGIDRIGQLIPQNIDRKNIANDAAILSVDLPEVKDKRDERYVTIQANKAILALSQNGGGPVHINITTTYSKDFSIRDLPDVKIFHRYYAWDNLPNIPRGKIGVFVGAHNKFSEKELQAIESFCGTYNAVVFCDHTSGYYGKYRVLPTLSLLQRSGSCPIATLDLLIHIGEVSAATFAGYIPTKEIWRVSEDGEIRNPFRLLKNVFQMSETFFFSHYAEPGHNEDSFAQNCKEAFGEIYANIPDLPFSNIWIAQQLSPKIPEGSIFHISASHSRRAWNIFPFKNSVETMCNVGCCGIDGCTSTLIGASLAEPNKLCYLVTGDLAFFYDLNVLGNHHVDRNVRILLINNGIGGEFKLGIHPCTVVFGDESNKYMAAGGHFGNKSPNLIKHFSQDLGFTYLSASTKEEFLKNMNTFVSTDMRDKPMIFEVFTDAKIESEALDMISSIHTDATGMAKSMAKKLLGDKGIKKLKDILDR